MAQRSFFFVFLMLVLLANSANATISPAGNYGFGPCAQVHGGNLPGNMRYNQCLTPTPNNLTQGLYCNSQGNLIHNCSDICPCMAGYYCSPPTGACTLCERGEACFAIEENKLVAGATDFLNFIPVLFPLLTIIGIGLLVFLLVAMLKHLGEYAD